MIWEVLLDSLLDTLKVLPILYLVYLLVSYLGHNGNNKYAKLMNRTKKFGPIIGGMTGSLPQCGFSIVMSDLYSKRAITLGTLIAVFVATSDEALPLMIAEPNFILPLIVMIAIKLVFAIAFGYMFDFAIKLAGRKQKINPTVFEKTHCHDCELTSCNHIPEDEKEEHSHKSEEHSLGHCCGGHHEHKHEHSKCCANNIFLDALIHTLKISAILFFATICIGLIIELAGMDNLKILFSGNKFVEPFITAFLGLIPSCASSVFLVKMFIEGGIGFGALVGGLSAGSGVGLFVLFAKNRKYIWQNILILIALYLIGVLIGQICNFLPMDWIS